MSEQPASCPAIRVMMMPRDTNATGTIFGGVLLSYIDQAGAIAAREHAAHKYVTVAMDSVVFKEAVFVGDVLSFHATVVRVGRTSITVHINVSAERFTDPRQIVPVTEAELTYVAVDEDRQPVPVEAK
jgi:acyl-CoA thioesterase YciA